MKFKALRTKKEPKEFILIDNIDGINVLFTQELQTYLGERISREPAVRDQHGVGFSYHECQPPDAVVYPQTTEEIAEIVKICAKYGVPIIPFGAGTSIEGHVLAIRGGVCMDLSLMNKILEVNQADMYVTVQAGVTRNQLDGLLEGSGFFPFLSRILLLFPHYYSVSPFYVSTKGIYMLQYQTLIHDEVLYPSFQIFSFGPQNCLDNSMRQYQLQ